MAITTGPHTGPAPLSTTRAAEPPAEPRPRDARFPLLTTETAPAASRPALDGVRERLGYVPNLLAVIAASPPTLQAYLTLDGVLARGALTAVERQLVLTAASASNGCGYCAAAHSTAAVRLGVAPDALAAARGTGHASDARLDALIGFAHALLRARGRVEAAELDRFTGAGFSAAQALEVVANVALKTLSNYIGELVRVPLDDALAAQRWEPSVAAAD